MGKTELLSFSIKTGLKNIIGKDLITDDYIAVFELVKNSYDAHSQNVTITFEDDRIILKDDGKGMSKNDLVKKWFAVAYSAKKDGSEDNDDDDLKRESYRDQIKAKRFYAGAKGIGRFSCDRLGHNLLLTSRKIGDNKINQVKIDWSKFENNEKEDFIKINFPYELLTKYHEPFSNNSKHGTILEIINLSSKWEREKIKNLKHSLEKLINPFSETNNFNIEIICKKYEETDKNGIDDNGKRIIERDKINGFIKNSILDILNLKTTQIEVEIVDSIIETKLIDRGTLIYHIKEPNYYKSFIQTLKINLYYLNRSAKVNFKKKMGIEPINYGSVFLFKNGFRVQPYGDTGDDSWGLDFRAQQGYSRFLSSRELFGRVDIITEKFEEFKEVSSRDGGLVETFGASQLMEAFKEMGLKRIERYVVGVLWGEAFIRRKYFNSDSEGKKLRESLLEYDKDSDDYTYAKSNVGSKIDFIQLIKSLSDDKNIEIIQFDKNLVDLVNENLEDVQPKFLKDLEKIANATNDSELKQKVELTEQSFKKLQDEKDLAEKKALDEEKLRKKAEEKAEKEGILRLKAEETARIEEEKRREAELQTERKEKERYKAELEKLKAEQRAREEEIRRKEEEEKRKEEEEARILAEKYLEIEKEKNSYLDATRKTLSQDAEDLIHSIKVSVIGIDASLDKLILNIENGAIDKTVLLSETGMIKFITQKALKISQLITKSRFKVDEEERKIDVCKFIEEYVETYSYAYSDKIKIEVFSKSSFSTRLSVLNLSVIIDNLISNSLKAEADHIIIDLDVQGKTLSMFFHDSGDGLASRYKNIEESIFELGVRSTDEGSGIGLSTIKKKMKEMNGNIIYVGSGIKLRGATFKLIFNK